MITEGIKYTGSKRKIIPYILEICSELDVYSALDAFAGTTRVSQAFAQSGYDTTCNDLSEWSKVFGNCYLLSNKSDDFYQLYIDELNSLQGYNGWFTEIYGNSEFKQPFQKHNLRKLDAIRNKIDEYDLEYEDKCVLLTSLILAMDKVDNTLGHYSAYLKEWSPRSYNVMKLQLPKRFPLISQNKVVQGDVFDVIKEYYDLTYFDPPYGSNNEKMPSSRVRYESYYHIWKSVILNDKPEVFGKANRRADSRDKISGSVFEEFRKNDDGNFIALEAIERLIKETNSHYIMLSYGSGGKATKDELFSIISSNGNLKMIKEIDYKKNVMSNMRSTNEYINSDGQYKEYLFLLEK